MIELRHINKEFVVKKQQVQALQDVSLTINDGDIFGIIGFSGAGKSTLLRMVNALETPTSGDVFIDGVNINALSHNELRQVRKGIGMVFQSFNLLNSKTVYDNIAIPLRLNKVDQTTIDKRVKELLEFVNLPDKANAYPTQLSGGQKQRVGIARALATNPSILLCDEATSALDPETTEAILALLKRINQEFNITVLVVTHEIQVIKEICNRVAVMEHGRVVETGTVLDVFSHPTEAMTKRFVQTVIPERIPDSIVANLQADTRHYELIKVRFLGDTVTKHVIYEINRTLAVETNIIFASVNQLQDSALGIFILQVVGDEATIQSVKEFISQNGLEWEVVKV
ncbi:methionine ABC transporter ATP-binding protein [Veillonella sp. R32]|uniref:methionine ABC transporter ATP-binding protein n=1 Tax=Veillonella sp. R32 TaxID=2021312 RepID=UPI00138A0454|nr:ATP-binding cassette domain-containing protein [Veillonella sp. R32]KAF1679277.1 methionine ABC transporter ATP-binding protein [Veillonella sp. R32]